MPPALQADRLTVSFPIPGQGRREVLRDVSLAVPEGACAGLLGASGGGKSTLARALMRLLPVDSGQIRYGETDVTHLDRRAMRPWRRHAQMVFQDPWTSLNPSLTVREILSEPLRIHFPQLTGSDRTARISGLLHQTGLAEELGDRLPSGLSGGQRQRVGLARALAVEPRVLICDEPVSALDVSIQAEILDLLRQLRRECHLSILFIGHDLAVLQDLCDTVSVLHHGQVVESGPTTDLFAHPRQPITRALIESVLTMPDSSNHVGTEARAR